MAAPSQADGVSKPPRTTLAFLLAPGSAALVGAAGSMVWWEGASVDRLGPLVVAIFYLSHGFALVGYPTALIVAVPVYILLAEHAREKFLVVVPLAGCIAAAPWIPIVAALDLGWLPIGLAFGLGCLTGVFFMLIRSLPRDDRAVVDRRPARTDRQDVPAGRSRPADPGAEPRAERDAHEALPTPSHPP